MYLCWNVMFRCVRWLKTDDRGRAEAAVAQDRGGIRIGFSEAGRKTSYLVPDKGSLGALFRCDQRKTFNICQPVYAAQI